MRMKTTAAHIYKVKIPHVSEKRFYTPWHPVRRVERKPDKDDSLSSLVIVGLLAALIFISLVVLPGILNWIFPT